MNEVIETKKVKEAMLTIYEWAKENNIEYFDFGAFPFSENFSLLHLTYAIKGSKEQDENGKIVNDYYKRIYIDLKEVE